MTSLILTKNKKFVWPSSIPEKSLKSLEKTDQKIIQNLQKMLYNGDFFPVGLRS